MCLPPKSNTADWSARMCNMFLSAFRKTRISGNAAGARVIQSKGKEPFCSIVCKMWESNFSGNNVMPHPKKKNKKKKLLTASSLMSYLVVFFLRKIQRVERGNLRAALHHSLSHFFYFILFLERRRSWEWTGSEPSAVRHPSNDSLSELQKRKSVFS